MDNFIAYSGNDENFITTPALEAEFIRQWFTEGGRSIDEYDREVIQEVAVEVIPLVRIK